MIDQPSRDLVLLKRLFDAVIQLVGNERKAKHSDSLDTLLYARFYHSEPRVL